MFKKERPGTDEHDIHRTRRHGTWLSAFLAKKERWRGSTHRRGLRPRAPTLLRGRPLPMGPRHQSGRRRPGLRRRLSPASSRRRLSVHASPVSPRPVWTPSPRIPAMPVETTEVSLTPPKRLAAGDIRWLVGVIEEKVTAPMGCGRATLPRLHRCQARPTPIVRATNFVGQSA